MGKSLRFNRGYIKDNALTFVKFIKASPFQCYNSKKLSKSELKQSFFFS